MKINQMNIGQANQEIELRNGYIQHNQEVIFKKRNMLKPLEPQGTFAKLAGAITFIISMAVLITIIYKVMQYTRIDGDVTLFFIIVFVIASLIISYKTANKVLWMFGDTSHIEALSSSIANAERIVARDYNYIEDLRKRVETLEKLEHDRMVARRKKAMDASPLHVHANDIGSQEGIGERRFYYLKVTKRGKVYYKIGITNRSVRERYSGNVAGGEKYEILYEKIHSKAETLETAIKRYYRKHNEPVNVLGTKGTEVFNTDILKMDVA